MNTEKLIIRQVVGLDAHCRKLMFSIWDITEDFDLETATPSQTISGELDSLESIIMKHTFEGAEIVIEASTNSFKLARRIEKLGREAIIVKSDTVKNFSPQYAVTDKSDAANLARARISKVAARVYIPTEEEQTYRSIANAHLAATKDCVRIANRIWGFCSENGLPLPKNLSITSAERLLKEEGDSLNAIQYGILDDLVWRFKAAQTSEVHYAQLMSTIVAQNPMMQQLLQVLGIGYIIAFTLVAYIGDIRRFKTPKKLCAYIGVVPTINASGEFESKNHRISRAGVPILKAFLAQGAQSAIRYGKLPIHEWARYISAKRQCRNIAIMALARKIVVYVWHIMMGHTIVYKEMPKSLKVKTLKVAHKIGKEKRAKLGYKTAKELSEAIIKQITSNIIIQEDNPPSN